MTAVQELARGWKDEAGMAGWLKERALKDEDATVRTMAMRELTRGRKEEPEVIAFFQEQSHPPS